jgi:hypothetical protein
MEAKKVVEELCLPELQDRETMKKILLENEYGYVRNVPYEISVSEPKLLEGRFCCGTAKLSEVEFTVTTAGGSGSFTVKRLLHEDGKKHPFFVFLNFRSNAPDIYYPVEEIAQRGFSVLSFNYKEITRDDDANPNDPFDRIAALLMPNGREAPDDGGKIAIWAWAASRVMDYAQTIPSLDLEQAAVMGHSRLGKTALVAGMLDERFKYVFSNDSGCSGASLARYSLGVLGKKGKYGGDGETISKIMGVGYWFCKNYRKYAETNIPDIFDQHFLLASIAPRYVYVASGAMDDWASPDGEFLSCVAASAAYEKMGLNGFVCDGTIPEVDDVTYPVGRIGYHRRPGMHFLSRVDWNRYMDFMELHKNDE